MNGERETMKQCIKVTVLFGLLALSVSAYAQPIIPGGVDSAGVSYIKPDTCIWYNTTTLPGNPYAGYVTNGFVDRAVQVGPNEGAGAQNGNWDAYTTVVGNSTFIVACGIFADGGTFSTPGPFDGGFANQRETLVMQSASGGAPCSGELLFDDAGQPYRFHTLLRQRNPGRRLGGDKRYGATEFMTGTSASVWYTPLWYPASGPDFYFNSDGRFSTNCPLYAARFGSCCNNDCGSSSCAGFSNAKDTFCAVVQNFLVDPATLTQTAVNKAQDCNFGRLWTNSTPPNTTANGFISNFGGDIVALDNGNYVAVTVDSSGFFGNANTGNMRNPVVTIFGPDGSIVKESWWIGDANQLWANVAAFRGGFCIRQAAKIYFFDNAGTPYKTNTVSAPIDTSRGDYARLGSDIRSSYVYLASPNSTGTASTNVNLAIWDTWTGNQVLITNISDDVPNLKSLASSDAIRCGVAVDALDRVCVVYHAVPDQWYLNNNQVMARVMAFDGTNVSFLTPTFLPFLNSNTNTANVEFKTQYPHVSMTMQAICIAAKGYVNSTNDVASGPDTKSDTTVYTVITHPEPQGQPRPTLGISRSGNDVVISWEADAGLFTLRYRGSAGQDGTWGDVSPQPATVTAGGLNKMTIPIGTTGGFYSLGRTKIPQTYTNSVDCGSSRTVYVNLQKLPVDIIVDANCDCVSQNSTLKLYDSSGHVVSTTPLPATVGYTLKQKEKVVIDCGPSSPDKQCTYKLTL
jgi:hypothetical protein